MAEHLNVTWWNNGCRHYLWLWADYESNLPKLFMILKKENLSDKGKTTRLCGVRRVYNKEFNIKRLFWGNWKEIAFQMEWFFFILHSRKLPSWPFLYLIRTFLIDYFNLTAVFCRAWKNVDFVIWSIKNSLSKLYSLHLNSVNLRNFPFSIMNL